ncbi:hypothetical protein OO014_17900 [Intrasporangium calvum]|uniref:Uncharacterized protein n=1 Tax=Intrasporangium calvum TaxID=53358 RepID=A0ABT5GLN3_9MICO|nr:hypothetical protein [Intrasporangium calvum]MDC5699127.1 hypothetical protein [Intrasporangium calvum]
MRGAGEAAMKEWKYDEFEVLLERSGDGYSARVVDSPTGPSPAMPFRTWDRRQTARSLESTTTGPGDAG